MIATDLAPTLNGTLNAVLTWKSGIKTEGREGGEERGWVGVFVAVKMLIKGSLRHSDGRKLMFHHLDWTDERAMMGY